MMPNFKIASPGDSNELKNGDYLTAHPQPSYLRLGKNNRKLLTSNKKNLNQENSKSFLLINIYSVKNDK